MATSISKLLRRVKALKGKMSELSARAAKSVRYEDAKKPAFNFAETRKELANVRKELVDCEAALATANATTNIKYGGREVSLAYAIRQLQEFAAELSWLQKLELEAGTETKSSVDYDEETGRSVRHKVETTYVTALSEVDRASQVEKLREQFAELNDLVEAANQTTQVELEEAA